MKQFLFDDLVQRVQSCCLCGRMSGRRRVLGSLNGSLQSPVVFIAEAPGRLGADKYNIPLYGDQTGRNFEILLTAASLKRENVFITNAVLCNPRTQAGNNDTPTKSEISNCQTYLIETLEIIKPICVVTLGMSALLSLNHTDVRGKKISEKVGQCFYWQGYLVYPLFHPSPRALIHRNLSKQMEDYKTLSSHICKHK